jgi:hypothetical protein
MSRNRKIIISIVLIASGVVGRLAPHPWNFAPLCAIALFAGVYLGGRYALLVPVIAMLIGDVFIGFYSWPLMLTVYGSYMFAGMLGVVIRKYKSAEMIVAGSLIGSVIFFLLTNWAVWQFSPWYAKTWTGLVECYTLALPFFRNTVLGDLFFVSVLFGAYELAKFWIKTTKKTVVIVALSAQEKN